VKGTPEGLRKRTRPRVFPEYKTGDHGNLGFALPLRLPAVTVGRTDQWGKEKSRARTGRQPLIALARWSCGHRDPTDGVPRGQSWSQVHHQAPFARRGTLNAWGNPIAASSAALGRTSSAGRHAASCSSRCAACAAARSPLQLTGRSRGEHVDAARGRRDPAAPGGRRRARRARRARLARRAHAGRCRRARCAGAAPLPLKATKPPFRVSWGA
jgi:hypothetical protein